jgi:hypothetical protein
MQGVPEVVDSPVGPALLGQGPPQADVGLDRLGPHLEGPLEGGPGVGGSALALEGGAQELPGVGVVGPGVQELAVQLLGLALVAAAVTGPGALEQLGVGRHGLTLAKPAG